MITVRRTLLYDTAWYSTKRNIKAQLKTNLHCVGGESRRRSWLLPFHSARDILSPLFVYLSNYNRSPSQPITTSSPLIDTLFEYRPRVSPINVLALHKQCHYNSIKIITSTRLINFDNCDLTEVVTRLLNSKKMNEIIEIRRMSNHPSPYSPQ